MLPALISITLYVFACWLLGYLGRYTKFGFWGNFWVSVIMTPIVGFVVLLAQENRSPQTPLNAPVDQSR